MIKVLYDIEQLLSAKGKETGICRVSLEVLKELNQRRGYEVYPLVTIKDKGAAEYLKIRDLKTWLIVLCICHILRKQQNAIIGGKKLNQLC